MNIKDKFLHFMQGRYGMDSLGTALCILYLLITFLNLFFVSKVLYVLDLIVLIVFLFRILSKNTAKRYSENMKYEKMISGIKRFWNRIRTRAVQNKTCCFKRCPNCGKTLRLPRKRGKHTTRCPLCNCSFSVRVWFGNK